MSQLGWYTGNMNEPDGSMWPYEFELENGQVRDFVLTNKIEGNQIFVTPWVLRFHPLPGQSNYEYVRESDFANPIYNALSSTSVFKYGDPEHAQRLLFAGSHDDRESARNQFGADSGSPLNEDWFSEIRYANPR